MSIAKLHFGQLTAAMNDKWLWSCELGPLVRVLNAETIRALQSYGPADGSKLHYVLNWLKDTLNATRYEVDAEIDQTPGRIY